MSLILPDFFFLYLAFGALVGLGGSMIARLLLLHASAEEAAAFPPANKPGLIPWFVVAIFWGIVAGLVVILWVQIFPDIFPHLWPNLYQFLTLKGMPLWLFTGVLIWLVILAGIDARYHLLPNLLIWPLFVVGAILLVPKSQLWLGHWMVSFHLLAALLGFGLLWVINYVMQRRRGVMGFGGGDMKLMAAMGLIFGLLDMLLIIFLASVLGIFWGMTLRLCAAGNRLVKRLVTKLPSELSAYRPEDAGFAPEQPHCEPHRQSYGAASTAHSHDRAENSRYFPFGPLIIGALLLIYGPLYGVLKETIL